MAHLRPGDVVLLDSARPYELHFPEGVHCVSLQLPRAWVGQWLEQPEVRGPRVAWRDQGWGQSLGALAVQLARDPALAQALPPALLSDHLGALLCALLRARIDQPGLSAPALAQSTYAQLSPHPYRTVTEPAQLPVLLAALELGKSYLNAQQDTARPHSLPWHPRPSKRLGLFRLGEFPGSHELCFSFHF